MQRLLRREPPKEAPCPRCGVPTPVDADACKACGWDLRESYHGPVGRHEPTEPETSRNG